MTAPLGFRQHPSTKLPTIESIRLTNDVLAVEQLVKENRNIELREFLFDLTKDTARYDIEQASNKGV